MLKKVLLFCFVLCLPSLVFAQQFKIVQDQDYYPSSANGTIPLSSSSGLAILETRVRPSSNFDSQAVVVYARIIPSYTYNPTIQYRFTSYGIGYNVPTDQSPNGSDLINYTVVSADTLYMRASNNAFIFNVLPKIQDVLASQNLGTVQQRAAFIRSFHSGPVQILDIDNFKKSILNALSPFLNIYLGIFLTLFVVDLMSKKSKDVIAESAKIQRRAERAQQRREMRADPTAQIFEFRLANFSSIASGSVSDPSISRRKARRLFEDTAMEYAEYKKSRGWKY